MKPTLKAPGSQRLILRCDELLSSFAYNFNLRRYNSVPGACTGPPPFPGGRACHILLATSPETQETGVQCALDDVAGDTWHALSGGWHWHERDDVAKWGPEVGRCRLKPMFASTGSGVLRLGSLTQ
jgi:hypothetical protein